MMLSFAVLLLSSVLAGGPEKGIELEATQRLGVSWSRAAIQMISEPAEPTPENFVGALEVARATAALLPDDPAGWRVVLAIAAATSGGVPNAKTAETEAINHLAKLDPSDMVLRLYRLTEAVDRNATADDRILAYEHLLKPEAAAKIAPQVASRLAYDFSLLLRRRGDTEAALEQLRASAKMDPSYPPAAAQLAAYQIESGAPLGTIANALVDAILANPTEITHLSELGAICLDEGLYTEADFLFSVACRVADVNLRNIELDQLISQQMLARWGMGNHKQASDLFNKRKSELIGVFRRKNDGRNAQNFTVAMPETMNAINAAICKSGSLPEFDKAFAEAIQTVDDDMKAAGEDAVKKSRLLLDKSWLTLAVGPDADPVPGWIAQAESLNKLAPEAKARFDGWIKLRTGMTDEAIAILEPLSVSNPAAKLGYALALAKSGKTKEAAKEFLTLSRDERSNAIGLYASDQLFALVKTRPGPSAKAAEVQAAVARFPKDFIKFAKDETPFMKVSAAFLATTAKPFDPLPYKIDITNQSPMTLSITPDGPIDSRAAIILETIAIGKQPLSLPPLVFPIDRKLALASGESMSWVVDVARTPATMDLVNHPLDGANLQAELFTNFRLTLENVLPGFLGRSTPKSSIRITPVIRNATWREEALGSIHNCDKVEDLVTLVLFAWDLASRSAEKGAEAEVKEGWQEVVAAWKKLPAAAQAWTLMVLPREPLDMTEPIAKAAKESQDFRVQMSAVLRWVDSENDAILATVARSGNEQLIAAASSVRSLIDSRVREASKINQSLEEAGVLGGTKKSGDQPVPTPR
ncbi:MAG: hypothetical protein K8R92_08310 [Planctomycetes bacterium]|nr:hypothetical protein [Planctomycetota bacterium]